MWAIYRLPEELQYYFLKTSLLGVSGKWEVLNLLVLQGWWQICAVG